MSGIKSTTCKAQHNPQGVPNPTRSAVAPAETGTASASAYLPTSTSNSTIRYARRYLDWNRNTFAYHAANSQRYATFDTSAGASISSDIASDRSKLNLTDLYGYVHRPSAWSGIWTKSATVVHQRHTASTASLSWLKVTSSDYYRLHWLQSS
jgi:hypothetical protein